MMRSCLATLRLPDGVEPSDDASSTVLKLDAVNRAERVIVTWSEAMPEAAGRDLFELARSPCFCCSVEEAAAKLQPAGAVYFAMDEDGKIAMPF
eukprot:COSAG02_NODE_241_length_27638_cov_13.101020_3_plen_94_part_00